MQCDICYKDLQIEQKSNQVNNQHQTITNSMRDDEYNKGILILALFYVLNIKRVFISADREKVT